MTTLKIIYRPISELKRHKNNARTHSDAQIAQIVNSINEFGWTNPILIDENGIIIAGHGRLEAAETLDLNEVPCIVLSGLTDSQKRAYLIADNQLALNAGWDIELLQSEIEALKLENFDIDLLGIDDELQNLLDTPKLETIGNSSLDDNPYTKKVSTPLYEPNGNKPEYADMYKTEKLNQLLSKINDSKIDLSAKQFLTTAAYRHVQFNYEEIANYYAHSDKEVQELMEDSALVIIDFNKSIEQGYLKLSDEVDKYYAQEN
ncbi:ParB N-terminal domain-containing protein [Frischella sp. Ac13]|uniref:ParB N-terminal domain-containing protein n=1 Tax=Frischella japonica TaxID=2741544 RepID=A0ABR7QWW7_9GAMM|nr:ParB/Srx family N-terminal domain-containing protein [Frischella japonica]MBC9130712.1 ParB N-terminal domain-containing protein [Frischella japonica]